MPIFATDACLSGARGYRRQCWIPLTWNWSDDCEQPCAGSHTQQNHLPSPNGPVLSDRTILKRCLFVLSAGVPSKIYHQQVILRGVYTKWYQRDIISFSYVFFCMHENKYKPLFPEWSLYHRPATWSKSHVYLPMSVIVFHTLENHFTFP